MLHARFPLHNYAIIGIITRRGYRAVYTVRFADAVYVLHVFQKKSKQGIATPKEEIEKVKARLKMAEELHHRKRG
ncbi:MAG: type II toxin-antitoxin system RelE/ParE family toxin [Geobacteraceae bacterium]|nr:type II toxin-antitoxin system RelE/ParE family toxin [Geobacteraceae bacterium]